MGEAGTAEQRDNQRKNEANKITKGERRIGPAQGQARKGNQEMKPGQGLGITTWDKT